MRRSLVPLLAVLALAACATGSDASPPDEEPLPADARGLAPTPYTADEIRDANPPGTELVYRVEAPGEPAMHRHTLFVAGDAGAARMRSWFETPEGEPVGEPEEVDGAWTELRDHAAFAADATTRARETVRVPAGSFETWRYTVTSEGQGGARERTRYWFAVERPGPPVRLVADRDGETTFRMELVEVRRR